MSEAHCHIVFVFEYVVQFSTEDINCRDWYEEVTVWNVSQEIYFEFKLFWGM
jgi:uncharacterized membrane protein